MGTIPPGRVKEVVGRHLPLSEFGIVVDLAASRGRRVRDALTGRDYLDLFSFYASAPLGMNHPALAESAFAERLLRVARCKPTNPDVYTVEIAEFLETLYRVAVPERFPHLFLVEGGAPAVENAMKAAFDWKVRLNLAKGLGEKGTQILHFREAFHGRTGYALSTTNTADSRKTLYFPKFAWPRVENPKVRFPAQGPGLEETVAAERRAVAGMEAAFAASPHDIAAILIEPVQSEGGDNHFRGEFLRELRRLADAHEALLIFDEVQTGVGITGRMWAFEHFGAEPDIVVFGKKMQVCGIFAGRRIDEVPDNVFAVPSRIGSTWGGNLTDMVRATRCLEVIASERLVENAARVGERLRSGLEALQGDFPGLVSNARGRGLLCAIDLPSKERRDALRRILYDRGVLVLPCGAASLRFRPPLDITAAEVDEGLGVVREALRAPAAGLDACG